MDHDEEKEIPQKSPTETQRKKIAEFTLRAFEGDYNAVYLTDINRKIRGDPLSAEFTSKLIPSCRYGKVTERDLLRMREVFADSSEILTDPEFVNARLIPTLHFFSPDHPHRRNVESDNIRATFDFAKRYGNKPHSCCKGKCVGKTLRKRFSRDVKGFSCLWGNAHNDPNKYCSPIWIV